MWFLSHKNGNVPVRCMSNHCACDKCRWEYSVVGACTFFTKSETPESKSSTKSSNFEAGNGNNNIKLALHTGPRTYYLCYCSIFVAPEAHLLKINAFSWNSLFAQLYRHVNLSVQCDMKLYESRIYPCNKRCIRWRLCHTRKMSRWHVSWDADHHLT